MIILLAKISPLKSLEDLSSNLYVYRKNTSRESTLVKQTSIQRLFLLLLLLYNRNACITDFSLGS